MIAIKKKKFSFLKFLEGFVLTILIVSFGILIYCIYNSVTMEKNQISKETEYQAKNLATDEEGNISMSDVIEKVNNSVVGISKIKNKGTTVFLEEAIANLGIGTGFIVSEDGYIITNQHVSGEKNDTCYVTLENGRNYSGSVVWADADIDISIVKINAGALEYCNLSDSDNIKIAQTVYAIGNPIGYEFQRSVTAGIVSGLDRTIKIEEEKGTYYMEDLIQTDASINPGNSGGPLINTKGEVIGINSVKITTAEGIGFASPINIIKPILDKFLNGEDSATPTLGIFAYDKNVIPYINQDLTLNMNLESGIYVTKVLKKTPADKVGLKEGDILESIDSIKLDKMKNLREYIYSKKVGDKVHIKYIRNKKGNEIDAILAKK